MSWRDRAAPIIYDIIQEVGTDDTKALRKALRDAYPFGARKWWPYKVWCDEIRRQLKLPRYLARRRRGKHNNALMLTGKLFDDDML